MTDLMELLFEFVMEERVPDLLPPKYYRHSSRLAAKAEDDLLATFTKDQRDLLEAYERALFDQSELEQRALFQAALSLARELP